MLPEGMAFWARYKVVLAVLLKIVLGVSLGDCEAKKEPAGPFGGWG